MTRVLIGFIVFSVICGFWISTHLENVLFLCQMYIVDWRHIKFEFYVLNWNIEMVNLKIPKKE